MVLFDDVVELICLVHNDWHVSADLDRIDVRLVGATFVCRDLGVIAVRARGLVDETLRRRPS